MIQKIQEELKKINWTSLAIGTVIGISAYYLYQKYTVKETQTLKTNHLLEYKTMAKIVKDKKTSQEQANLQLLINYPNLEVEEQDFIQNWLLEKIDESQICTNALNYFWFLDESHIKRFDSTVNDNFDLAEYLEYEVDWEKWNENLAELISEIKNAWEKDIALGLAYEIEEEINRVKSEIY